MAGFASGCADLPGILYSLSGAKVSVSTEGSHGTCCSGSSMGSGGDGLTRLVGHISKGQSVCFSDGGLFLQMDGGMSVAALSVADAFSNMLYAGSVCLV